MQCNTLWNRSFGILQTLNNTSGAKIKATMYAELAYRYVATITLACSSSYIRVAGISLRIIFPKIVSPPGRAACDFTISSAMVVETRAQHYCPLMIRVARLGGPDFPPNVATLAAVLCCRRCQIGWEIRPKLATLLRVLGAVTCIPTAIGRFMPEHLEACSVIGCWLWFRFPTRK